MNILRAFFLLMLSFILAPGFALAQTAQRSDGWVSNSAHFLGTCIGHGGVEVWFNKEMEEQANESCDENPDLCANSHWKGIGGHGNHPDDRSELQSREQKPACDRHFPMDLSVAGFGAQLCGETTIIGSRTCGKEELIIIAHGRVV